MEKIQAPPQKGSIERAPRLLPLGKLLGSLLIGALFCVIATLGFVWLAVAVLASRFITVDDQIITWLHGYWGPLLDQLMHFFTLMGESVVLALFIGLAAVLLWRRGRWIDAAGLVLAGAGAGIINQVLKASFQRVRPDLFAGPFRLSSYSFPSGHSMGSIACYGMLAFVAVRLARRRVHKVAIILFAALLVLCIGLSRVYFGVHFPTDVLGGFTAGAIWLVIVISAVRVAEWYVERRAQPSARPVPGRDKRPAPPMTRA